MKIRTNTLLIISLLSLIFSSCSMEKRLYQRGYNVGWKNSNSQKVSPKDNITAEKETGDIYAGNNKNQLNAESYYSNATASVDENIVIEEKKIEINHQEVVIKENFYLQNEKEQFKNDSKISYQTSADDPPVQQVGKRKTHWASIVGLISSFLAIFIFGLPLGIAGIIFSAIGLSETNKHPDLYAGKAVAIIGLILGILCTFIVLLVLTG